MTTFSKKEITCGVCGESHSYRRLMSFSTFGSMDMDTRPPEMYRSTMGVWVHECPGCGYCSHDIQSHPPESDAVVASSEYQRMLNRPGFPRLANRFLCAALIQDRGGEDRICAWTLLRAAWTFDDHDDYSAESALYRLQAVEKIRALHSKGEILTTESKDVDIAVLVDLLRRAGSFIEAQQVIDDHIDSLERPNVRKGLIFQEKLIARNDAGCYTLKEAEDEYDRLF